VSLGLLLFPSKGERFSRGGNLSCLELLLVVLSRLPLSGGTSFDIGTLGDFVLQFGFICSLVVFTPA
jgi:hypothetical protein